MKAVKLFATCMFLATSMFIFSACEKDDPTNDPQSDTPTEQDDPTATSIEETIVGEWTITASQESFQYSEGADWDDVTDAVVGEKFVFKADKTGWMYFEEDGTFTWSCNGSKIEFVEPGDVHMTGTVTVIDNNNIKLNNLTKPRYKGTITLKRK